MIISFAVAMDKNRVIGKDNDLPWNMPADLARFRELTKGKPNIMGRKTHESIGRVLPNRPNIILTRDKNYKKEGCIVVHTVEEAIEACKGAEEIMVIGGSEIFKMFLDKANRMYLTYIDAEVEGDTYFPEFNKEEWKETSKEEHKADSENKYDYVYVNLEKK